LSPSCARCSLFLPATHLLHLVGCHPEAPGGGDPHRDAILAGLAAPSTPAASDPRRAQGRSAGPSLQKAPLHPLAPSSPRRSWGGRTGARPFPLRLLAPASASTRGALCPRGPTVHAATPPGRSPPPASRPPPVCGGVCAPRLSLAAAPRGAAAPAEARGGKALLRVISAVRCGVGGACAPRRPSRAPRRGAEVQRCPGSRELSPRMSPCPFPMTGCSWKVNTRTAFC
jgi:hypothetical protein